jgi:large subunit ribosomal protein L31
LTKHPNSNPVDVRCTSCGAEFSLRSSFAGPITVDVCSSCHPAYTGAPRAAARGDRIERFERRRALPVSM